MATSRPNAVVMSASAIPAEMVPRPPEPDVGHLLEGVDDAHRRAEQTDERRRGADGGQHAQAALHALHLALRLTLEGARHRLHGHVLVVGADPVRRQARVDDPAQVAHVLAQVARWPPCSGRPWRRMAPIFAAKVRESPRVLRKTTMRSAMTTSEATDMMPRVKMMHTGEEAHVGPDFSQREVHGGGALLHERGVVTAVQEKGVPGV